MSMTDPLADMLTIIRNGQRARLASVHSPVSKLRASVLNVLVSEGYIQGFTEIEHPSNENLKKIKIELKYSDGAPVIKEIQRVSKPGRRVYSSISSLPEVYNRLGISIVSTSKGVMSDDEARKLNIGGEVLCTVF